MKKEHYTLTNEGRNDIIGAMLLNCKIHSFAAVLTIIISLCTDEHGLLWVAALQLAFMVYTFMTAFYVYAIDDYGYFLKVLSITCILPNCFIGWLFFKSLAVFYKLFLTIFKRR